VPLCIEKNEAAYPLDISLSRMAARTESSSRGEAFIGIVRRSLTCYASRGEVKSEGWEERSVLSVILDVNKSRISAVYL
jgi:hypothetical protein